MPALTLLSLFALLACEDPYPQAFDYHIDRTLVPGLRLSHRYGLAETPRDYEAFLLSPHEVLGARAEICGLRTDMRSFVTADCFAEERLITQVGTGRSGSFTLPPLEFECPETTYSTHTDHSEDIDTGGGSGLTWSYGPNLACASLIPWRLVVQTTGDMGYGYAGLSLLPTGTALPTPPEEIEKDPAAAEVRVEHIDGEVTPGGRVYLRASLSQDYIGEPGIVVFRWYVDDGELLGTGRTGATGAGDGRVYADNTLLIPDDYRRDRLRVAVVVDDKFLGVASPMVWEVLTLEVR